MILNTEHNVTSLTSVDHFELYAILQKMVLIESISKEEMESLLIKSGLTKKGEGIYEDERGSVLTMNVVKQ
jgi:hypothetical protein